MPEYAIVMSATVKPEGVPLSVRNDPLTREGDYRESILYYLQAYPEIGRLIFIENSGWPLDALRDAAEKGNIHKKKFEFISLNINHFTGIKGKGYGELRLMDEGFDKSTLIHETSHILKVTGRLRMLNMTRILNKVGNDFDLLGDVPDYGLYRIWKKSTGRYCQDRWCDTRLLGASVKYYDNRLRGCYDKIDDSKNYMVEHLIYDRIITDQKDWKVTYRLPFEPRWAGISGTYNSAYHATSMKDRVRIMTRAAFRLGDRLIGPRFELA